MSATLVVFTRPDGTHGRAELAECDSWGNLSLPWGRSQATPPACLYRTPDGEYFRPLRLDEITLMGADGFSAVRRYVAVDKADAERFIETEGKPPGRPVNEYRTVAEWLRESARAIRLSAPVGSERTGGPTVAIPARPTARRRKREIASLMIRVALETLAARGEWNAPESRIIELAGVPRSTYYSVLKRDKKVQQARRYYQQMRLGKGPTRYDQL